MSSRFLRIAPLLLCLFLSTGARAEEPAARQLATALLTTTGTAAVFDPAVVQAALKDPAPFLGEAGAPRFERLLAEAGLRRWQPPRVWLLQEVSEGEGDGKKVRWENAAALLQGTAGLRGYPVVMAQPLPSALEAMSYLSPGKEHPGLLGLLAAYDADMLVLLRGRNWTAWSANGSRQGVLAGAGTELLADVLAEVAAAEQQWPEARGRSVLQVDDLAGLADFAAVQAALLALPGVQQLQLIRAEKSRIWFAWAAPSAELMSQAMAGEPRLLAGNPAITGLPKRVADACRLACRQQLRRWQPESATKPPAAAALSVQSPALH